VPDERIEPLLKKVVDATMEISRELGAPQAISQEAFLIG
jgi:hypothetical protein